MGELNTGMGMDMGMGDPENFGPSLVYAMIAEDGETLTLIFSEVVSQGVAYNDSQIDVDATTGGANIGVTYVSGDGTGTHIYTLASTITDGDTVNLDFDGTANSLEDSTGKDLAAISDFSVVNNSTVAP